MFDRNSPNFECFYPSMWRERNSAREKRRSFHWIRKEVPRTCDCAFFLQRITVSRPTRSITSRIRSCFSNTRAGTSVVFDDEVGFFFQVFEDSVNMISLVVSPALRKSFDLEICNINQYESISFSPLSPTISINSSTVVYCVTAKGRKSSSRPSFP